MKSASGLTYNPLKFVKMRIICYFSMRSLCGVTVSLQKVINRLLFKRLPFRYLCFCMIVRLKQMKRWSTLGKQTLSHLLCKCAEAQMKMNRLRCLFTVQRASGGALDAFSKNGR